MSFIIRAGSRGRSGHRAVRQTMALQSFGLPGVTDFDTHTHHDSKKPSIVFPIISTALYSQCSYNVTSKAAVKAERSSQLLDDVKVGVDCGVDAGESADVEIRHDLPRVFTGNGAAHGQNFPGEHPPSQTHRQLPGCREWVVSRVQRRVRVTQTDGIEMDMVTVAQKRGIPYHPPPPAPEDLKAR
ncbi:hypothetical protein E5288_WYG003952 [Bos mutus]|uniref:Uncharacterized protein n=1 Tax=Bos mutus TaxID=72004 RepID=A0A6B0SB07_9CETA|nr:hypothetical protein [Bos mutus]